jgi:hypothetical protein
MPHDSENNKSENGVLTVTYLFSCGKKYVLTRSGAIWKSTELAPCRSEIVKLKDLKIK